MKFKNKLNENFYNICGCLWIINKVYTLVRIGQNQYFLFLNLKEKIFKISNIKYGDIQIKQLCKVKYLGCLMDETLSGEPKALNVIKKINKLRFLNHKNNFLTQALRCLLCNLLIYPNYLSEVFHVAMESNIQL